MGRTPKTALDTKYKCILARERSWANSVAAALIKTKPLTVWEIMIPIIFIFNYARSKNEREILVQNILFTKELALKAAFDMIKNNRSRRSVMSPIEEKTNNLLSSTENGIYSEDIRRKQLKEIDLLIDHHCKLLKVEGKDYDSLVMNAYQSLDNYSAFLDRLKGVEKEVNLSAMQTLGSKGDPKTVSKMEDVIERLRMASAQNIFGRC